MTTLTEAWAWYHAVKDAAKQLSHLSAVWGKIPWDDTEGWPGQLRKDNVLRDIQPDRLLDEADKISTSLDDHAILVFFSVFEANVRDWVVAQIRPEIEQLKHRALISAGADLLQTIAEGSFFGVVQKASLLGNS